MSEKQYVPIALPSAEAPKPPADPDRGERLVRGRIATRLPVTMKPCPVVYDEPGPHDPECECLGTGEVPIRKPHGELLDTRDDSLAALEDALDGETPVDAYLGDTVTNLMHRDVDVKGGGGGGGRKRRDKALKADEEAPRSAIDGRLERTGRRPRFAKAGARKDAIGTTVAPATAAKVDQIGADVAVLADALLANPEMQAMLAELKTGKVTHG